MLLTHTKKYVLRYITHAKIYHCTNINHSKKIMI